MIWQLAKPLFFSFPAEPAHYAAMGMFRLGTFGPFRSLLEGMCRVENERLKCSVAGIEFPNPVGLAAGFDKDARWFNQLSALGFGHVEIGTLTALPQPGNPKPRLFRLPTDEALVNRMGFNNSGSKPAAERLARTKIDPILGINIGKSKVTPLENALDDYLASLRAVYPFARYITINVSSPNTPGLRKLQNRDELLGLVSELVAESTRLASQANSGDRPKPVFLKIAPDLNDEQISDVVEICLASDVSAIIATNTTISREGLKTKSEKVKALGDGGLSGGPLTPRSREVVASLYRHLRGRIPIIGVGGIMRPEDAWEMIAAGANLVQVYTGFVYGGPFFVRNINRYLQERLEKEQIESISDVVGSGIK